VSFIPDERTGTINNVVRDIQLLDFAILAYFFVEASKNYTSIDMLKVELGYP
jgi:hypothetical protein